MSESIAAPASAPLLFNWEPPRRRRLSIFVFVLLSLLAHAFCFYLFQIVYPPTVALLPPPAHVSLISANTEEGRTLLRWIDAEDPALAFATQRPPEARLRALPKITHVPSYLASAPALKEPPPPDVDVRMPSSQPPGPVPIAREATPSFGVSSTTVLFSEEFAALGVPSLPTPSFVASTNEPPQAVRFRVAIDGRGDVRYCFPVNSSGDPALDEQARHYLMLGRFPGTSTFNGAGNQSLVWGLATVEFGNDVAPPKASSNKTGAP
ncbi:MAG: hypothetical protein ABR514_05815 [Chthoniobacterales bacterium]